MNRRTLVYTDIAAALADIERLRRGHTAAGGWTLAQACYHCAWPMKLPMNEATATGVTEAQKPFRDFLDGINVAGKWPDEQLPSPPMMAPPADANETSIDDYVAGLKKLDASPVRVLDNQAFGPVPMDDYRRFTLIHAAHHFSHFHPTA